MKTLNVGLHSLAPLMFNAFRGQEKIPPERKLYISGKDGKTIILPASNIVGFLASRQVGRSCVNTFVDAKERPAWTAEILASVCVDPIDIPILRNGEKIYFGGEWNQGLYVDERAAQGSKTVRDIVQRPVLAIPWEINFNLIISETKNITAERMLDWFQRGGIFVGLCAFRPFFGRFEVVQWDEEI